MFQVSNVSALVLEMISQLQAEAAAATERAAQAAAGVGAVSERLRGPAALLAAVLDDTRGPLTHLQHACEVHTAGHCISIICALFHITHI